jgi:hypothetical protein
MTRQNKVFRMPKCTYERGTQSTPFKKGKGDRKGDTKGDERGTQSTTNPEPITYNHEEERMASQKPYLSSSWEGKNTSRPFDRPMENRPKDPDAVYEYIFDCEGENSDEENAKLKPLVEFLRGCDEEEEERQIDWWFYANQGTNWKTGGRYIENWKAWLLATFHAGKFPSQRKGKKS